MTNNFNTLTVFSKVLLTQDAVLLTFSIPDEISRKYIFDNGQYLILEADIENRKIRRTYSICSCAEENHLSIVVKVIDRGVFSNYVKNTLVKGDKISVSFPEGKFTYNSKENDTKSKVLFVAAGSGITPVISIIKGILINHKNTDVTLLFANKNKASTIFYDDLENLRQTYGVRFNLIFIFSQVAHENHYFGRIDEAFISNFLSQQQKKYFDQYFLCGPEGLVNTLKVFLANSGEKADKIKYELFFSQIKEDKGIHEPKSTIVTLEVISDGESVSIEVSNNLTLLESLLKQGYNVNYSCQKGNCSSCVAKVISGSAEMKQNNVLMDYEVEDGFILCCQSIPTSEELVISFDEY